MPWFRFGRSEPKYEYEVLPEAQEEEIEKWIPDMVIPGLYHRASDMPEPERDDPPMFIIVQD